MKFIIGFLVTIGLLIFVFVLIFRGGGNNQPQKLQTKLLDYANSSVEMQMTVRGAVSADQTHKEYRITVGSSESTIEVFNGYQGNLVNSQSYPNNSAAYADFLQALQLAGYTLGNSDKKVADERGYCATGIRYVMGIKDGNKDIQRFWTTSCGGAATFKGKTNLVTGLFDRQIPDFEKIAGDAL
jgi:hypothetical protein